MYHYGILIFLIFTATSTASTQNWEEYYHFQFKEKIIEFKTFQDFAANETSIIMPSGSVIKLREGKYSVKVIDIIQTPDQNIFMLTDSNVGCWIHIFDGSEFQLVSKKEFTIQEVKDRRRGVVAYGLQNLTRKNIFLGLLIWEKGKWIFYKDQRKVKKTSAVKIDIGKYYIEILHTDHTKSSFGRFDQKFRYVLD